MFQPINTIIISNSNENVAILRKDLKSYPEVRITQVYTSLSKIKKIRLRKEPYVIFLDISAPISEKLELIQEIKRSNHHNVCVIFLNDSTSSIHELPNYIIDSLEMPYTLEELEYVVEKVKERFTYRIFNLEGSMRHILTDERDLGVQTLTGLKLLKCSEILYFDHIKHPRGWQMTLVDETKHKIRSDATGEQICFSNKSFLQINQTCIINRNYLKSIENRSYQCILIPPFDRVELFTNPTYYAKIKQELKIL